jgi:hypothetical protein
LAAGDEAEAAARRDVLEEGCVVLERGGDFDPDIRATPQQTQVISHRKSGISAIWYGDTIVIPAPSLGRLREVIGI